MIVLFEILLLVGIVLLDLSSKALMVNLLEVENHYGDRVITVIKGVLSFDYGENTGAGFGIFQGNAKLLAWVTLIFMLAIAGYLFFYRKDHTLLRLALFFVLGGGLGNLVDRFSLGYVRDFIRFDFIDFPVFNLADTFITFGGVMLVAYAVLVLPGEIKAEKRAKEKSDG